MTTAPSSPRRRHILSSINPDLPRLSPEEEDRADSHTAPPKSEPHLADDAGDERARSKDPDSGNNDSKRHSNRKTTKFRFKSKHSSSHRSSRRRERNYDDDDDDRRRRDREGRRHSERSRDDREEEVRDDDLDRESRRSHRRSHHHGEHHKHKRRRHRHRTRTRSPTPPNPHEPPPLDPEAAFRESLFDAMADDEGAAYWEGVYGQPIHVYANARPSAEGGGELEQMTDDEYAAYVRQKMWEKTHQGLLEERARREEAKKAKDDKEAEARRLTRQMEESLRRGEDRQRRRSWREKYEEYAAAWASWDGTLEGMSWPVAKNSSSSSSAERAEISPETVRDFFVNGLDPIEIGESVFLAKLKEERFRWHPDKIQAEARACNVRRDVTAVFQIIDKLWSDVRAKAKAKA
ncbi:hypothetical protein PG994_012301 [Apiospora phragmitis]|uniref:Uncharacterized protein n=1 Tax=Apiospora phragmitis TaxID=2905665 RepID=A0ABR1TXJ3_9PEZI